MSQEMLLLTEIIGKMGLVKHWNEFLLYRSDMLKKFTKLIREEKYHLNLKYGKMEEMDSSNINDVEYNIINDVEFSKELTDKVQFLKKSKKD